MLKEEGKVTDEGVQRGMGSWPSTITSAQSFFVLEVLP
jgi:hypothetical protein